MNATLGRCAVARVLRACALSVGASVGIAATALAQATSSPPTAPRRFTTQSPCTDAQRAAGCLIVLGSGTPVPDPDHAGAAYALVYGDRTLLFDAGAGVMRRVAAAGLPIDGIAAAFLTHLHSDHTLGLPDLLLTTWVMGRRAPFTLFGPPGTQSMVNNIFAAWAEDIRVRTSGGEHGQPNGQRVSVRETQGGVLYDSAGIRVTAVRVPHGEWKVAFAYVVKTPSRTMVLSGDTAPSDALMHAAKGADVLVHEVYPSVRLRPENRPGGDQWPAYMKSVHTSDVELGTLAAAAGVKQLILSHIVRMGGTDDELRAGVMQGGYRGPLRIARDLDAY
jgi:ribonuclease BN (tRNA processing enzyme)